jgi:hypothetical protein
MEPLLLCVADAEKRRGGGKKRRGVGKEVVASLTGTDGGGSADGHRGCHCCCLRRCREERERKAQMRARVRASRPLAGFVPPKSKGSHPMRMNGSDRAGQKEPRRAGTFPAQA